MLLTFTGCTVIIIIENYTSNCDKKSICEKVFEMDRKILRILSVMIALLTAFSAMSSAVSAAEIDDEEAVAEIGAVSEEAEELADTAAALADDEAVAEVGATPVITALEPCTEGIVMRWQAMSGVSKYRVDKYYDDGRGWQKLAETAGLSYVDTAVTSGKTYQYRLMGLNAGGSVTTSTATKSLAYYAVERVTEAEAASNGIRVYWNKEDGVSKTAVYRMKDGSWHRIASSADSSYLDKDVSVGNEYCYTVRSLNADGAFLHDFYDDDGFSIRYLKTPSLQAENAAGGVKLSWDAVDGAEQYRIFYKNSKGIWTRMAVTAENSFLDDDVRSGNTYTYTVRCISGDGNMYTSYYDPLGKSVKYIAAPVLLSADSTGDGIMITWQKSDGAAKYRVFYKNSKGSWSRLGDTASTSFTDTDVRSGSSYTYTVRCMDASGNYISSYYGEGIRGTYLSAPVVSVSNGAEGVDIRWDAVTGAEKYRVYYYGSKGWTKMVDTTETSYTDTDVSSNHNYTYTVRCINAAGTEFTSGFLAGKKIKYYAAPKITACTNTETGVKIAWDAVDGAEKYRVYYYGRNGWTKMADTADTSYVDKVVSSGSTYLYTVRCVNSAGTAFMSYFKPGVSHMYVAAPDFSLSRNPKSITVGWNEVKGAALYRVYSKTAGGWKKLIDTTETSYTDTNVASGSTYTYTVRCLNADATAFTSDYHAGKSMKLVNEPKLLSAENTVKGPEIKWEASPGASKYRVYYKTDDGWNKIGETTGTSFTHAAAASGTTYTYTVRCINAAGTDFESTFDRTGKTVHYIAAPANMKAEWYGDSIKISWTPSQGAEKYRVYYYGSRGWTKMVDTAEASYIDDDVTSGYTYRYTVRCINADGTEFTSDCDTTGVTCKITDMPVLYEPDYTKDGIELSWSKSQGAEKYRVYYYGRNGWTKLTETTSTSAVDTDVSSGHTYRYTVRCITADGKSFTSDYDSVGVKVYYVSAPKMLSSDSDGESLSFSWNKPNGATKFRVYKRVGGSWKRLSDTTATSYTDTDVELGETYTYTVRVISDDSSRFYSGFDPNGFIVTVTSQVVVDGFVYYDQNQYNYPYGDDTIAYSGCGPTSFAMIASTLTGKSITPVDAVKWCGNKYYMMGVGTYWSYFEAAADHFGGIKMEQQLGKNEFSSVVAALKKGKYVISAQSAGIFTRGGHFIVLAGITSSGKIIVYDPNGGNHYIGTSFDQSQITASGTQYWVFDKK